MRSPAEAANSFPEEKKALYESKVATGPVAQVAAACAVEGVDDGRAAVDRKVRAVGWYKIEHARRGIAEEVNGPIASRAGAGLPETETAHDLCDFMPGQANEIDLAGNGPIVGVEGVGGCLVEADRAIEGRTHRRSLDPVPCLGLWTV